MTSFYSWRLVFMTFYGEARGDHYAKPGANDRIWNALEKLAAGKDTATVLAEEAQESELLVRELTGPTVDGHLVRRQVDAERPHFDALLLRELAPIPLDAANPHV